MKRLRDPRTGRVWTRIAALVRYIVETQHSYLRLVAPHLGSLQVRLVQESQLRPEQLDKIGRQLVAMSTALLGHVHNQETRLFSKLTERETTAEANEVVRSLAAEHRRLIELCESVLSAAREARCAGRNGCVAELCRDLENLLARLQEHRRLELEILVPALTCGDERRSAKTGREGTNEFAAVIQQEKVC